MTDQICKSEACKKSVAPSEKFAGEPATGSGEDRAMKTPRLANFAVMKLDPYRGLERQEASTFYDLSCASKDELDASCVLPMRLFAHSDDRVHLRPHV